MQNKNEYNFLFLGYDWLFVTTDQAHGVVVDWQIDPDAARLEPGSFQPVVTAAYENNFTITLDKRNREFYLGSTL
jgi:hypothetical protein